MASFKIPDPIKDFLKRNPWLWTLIFGLIVGGWIVKLSYDERINALKDIITSKNEVITEYRERLRIRDRNEGPYQFYTDLELKDRAIELSRQIERLCEQNVLLSLSENYQQVYDDYKTNPAEHISERLEAPPGLFIWGYSEERIIALEKLEPRITQDNIGRTLGDLFDVWAKNVSKAIEPELKRYKKEYMQHTVELKDEMLSRMAPRAWRHYRFHVDPRNPGLYLIGVAIQLREIANDLI